MHGLDLFSGIGGIGLALKPWVRTVAYCEQDRYAQGVLLSRMRSGELDRAPIWDDVRTLKAEMLPDIDIIYGGFPCQDISVAGRGAGLAGERSGLFFEIARLSKELKPRFIFLENVPAIRTRGGEEVGKELASLGYDCRWDTLSAAEMGAPHKRMRWFLLSHANRIELRDEQGRGCGQDWQRTPELRDDGEQEYVANADGLRELQPTTGGNHKRDRISHGSEKMANAGCSGLQGAGNVENSPRDKKPRQSVFRGSRDGRLWDTEPDVGRVAHGVPFRVDRIRCLGNGVVPPQVEEAFEMLSGLNE